MEKEILQTLQEIRGILYFLTVVVSLIMLILAASWVSNILANFKKAWENDFTNRADKYFERGDFDKLAEHCEEKLSKYPNHSNAIWWLARAKLEKRESAEAKLLFEKLLELEPGWRETHLEPYLRKLSTE